MIILFTIIFLIAGNSYAIETITSLDDGFATPSDCNMIESSMLYPGAETFIKGSFAVCAWRVPFGVEDLAITSIHGGVNLGKAGISASFNSSGFSLYGEEQIKLGISFSPYKHISAGIKFARNAMHIKGFGDADAISSDLGIVINPFDTVFLAASFEDIFNTELGKSKEPLDGVSRFAATWKVLDQITLISSAAKVRGFDLSFSDGFTAEIMNALTFGVIGGNEPDRFEFLGTVILSDMHFSYRSSFHSGLGMSQGFSISWGYN